MIVHIDEAKVEELVRNSNEWRSHCEELARKGVAYAQSIAPVKTGAYRASLSSTVAIEPVPGSVSGAPAVLISSDDEAALEIEFQSPKRYHTLLRTLDYLAGEV